MPQTKFNCKGCRRLVSIESAFCPFCKTPNEHYIRKQDSTAAASENASGPSRQDISAYPKPTPAGTQTGEDSPADDIQTEELSLESLESMYRRVPVKNDAVHEKEQPSSTATPLMEDNSFDEIVPENKEPISGENRQDQTNDNIISSSGETHRIPIDWKDEKNRKEPEYTEMFNEKGEYQANYDGYYNDTLPKLQNEIDRALASKEKIILKGIFALVVIIAIIVYLVVTI